MKTDGWGLIQVPMSGDTTREDPSITDPAQRELLYGQDDHVRMYGRDFIDRLADAGFAVTSYHKTDWLDRSEMERLSVACEDEVILVRRKG